jgi:hypothetical protein
MLVSFSRDDLRLLFMREGKIAGRLWNWLEEDAPVAVRAQLLALIEAVSSAFSELGEDDRDGIMSTFLAAARKARAPGEPAEADLAEATPDALRARVAMMHTLATTKTQAREQAWAEPSDEALGVARELLADLTAGISERSAAVLYREVGRLTAPLWVSGDLGSVPDLTDVSTRALQAALAIFIRPERRFDESRSAYRAASHDEVFGSLKAELIDALSAGRSLYFADHPVGGALPSDPDRRRAEQDRRVQIQAAAETRARAALDQIMLPVLDAAAEYASERAAEAEAEAAAAALRKPNLAPGTEDGIRHPGPQPYGVSARGAERWVADALRWLGEHDVELIPGSPDRQAVILTDRVAVIVKHVSESVLVEDVRETLGVAMRMARAAVLWTSATLDAIALQFADLAPVAVVGYDVEDGDWRAMNTAGAEFLATYERRHE